MTRYRLRVAPQDGQPHIETIEADSMEEAMAYVNAEGLKVDAIEAINAPGQFEPAVPMPPTAPRPLPANALGANEGPFMLFFGLMFTLIPMIFVVVGLGLIAARQWFGLFFLLFPMIHLSIGGFTLRHYFTTRKQRTHLYSHGIPATATIDRARKRNVRINNRRQFELEWTFYVNDRPFHGKRITLSPSVLEFVEGDQIWVLYDPSNPEDSVEWPPITG